MCDDPHRIFPAQEAHPSFHTQNLLLEFHYGGMIDWITTCMTELHIQPLPVPPGFGLTAWGSKLQLANHIIVLSGMASPNPESSHKHKISRGPPWVTSLASTTRWGLKGPPWITKTFPSLRKFQRFRGYLPGTKDKGQPDSLLHNQLLTSLWVIRALGQEHLHLNSVTG